MGYTMEFTSKTLNQLMEFSWTLNLYMTFFLTRVPSSTMMSLNRHHKPQATLVWYGYVVSN